MISSLPLVRGDAGPQEDELRHANELKGDDMANTKSAKKAARQATRRTEVNKARSSRSRTAVRGVEEAIAAGNKQAAIEALKAAAPILARTAQKGVLHKKAVSRKVSRLNARVKAMAN
jgi:small subunit ribosomal protein S20